MVAVASGFVASSIAQSKGHSGVPYFVLGFLLPLIGILAAGFMAPVESAKRPQSTKNPSTTDLALATLRPVGDAKTDALLSGYRGSMRVAIGACDADESILAFGRGAWGVMPVIFVLTDEQFVIVKEGASRAKSVRPLDSISLSDDASGLVFPDGVIEPFSSSPFTAAEVVALIQGRHQSPKSVEVTGSGTVVASSVPDLVEPARDTVDDLERLDALHRNGAIDDDEFAELKRKLVWGDGGSAGSSG